MFSCIHSQRQNKAEKWSKWAVLEVGAWTSFLTDCTKNVLVWNREMRNHPDMKTTCLILDTWPPVVAGGVSFERLHGTEQGQMWLYHIPVVFDCSGFWRLRTRVKPLALLVCHSSHFWTVLVPWDPVFFLHWKQQRICDPWSVQWRLNPLFFICFNVLGDQSAVVSRKTHGYISTRDKCSCCTCRYF